MSIFSQSDKENITQDFFLIALQKTEFGDARTTTMCTDGQYETILQFTRMSEEEIYTVLDHISP